MQKTIGRLKVLIFSLGFLGIWRIVGNILQTPRDINWNTKSMDNVREKKIIMT